MKKILVFGTGKFYRNRADKLKEIEIIAFLDNDPTKWGQNLDGHMIVAPDYVSNYEYEYVLIMSIAEEEMRMQLHELGVYDNNILSYKDYLAMYGSVNNTFLFASNYIFEKKNVILFSHASDLSGAPLALVYLARILKKLGKNPIIVCQSDGALHEAVHNEELTMLITESISIHNPVLGSLINNAEFIVANTIVMYPLIRQLNGLKIPVIWWIHETRLEYDKLRNKGLEKFELKSNIHPFGVGRVAQEEFYNYWGKKIDSLVYSLPDFYTSHRIVFAVVGLITIRKGQDLFIDAIEHLPSDVRKKAEFWVIGDYNREEKEYCSKLFERVDRIEEVKYLGQLTRKEIEEKYRQIDVIVMPSRMDPMPIAIVEGFMNHKVCILSSATAVSDFVTDGVDGFVFESENVDELSAKINRLIIHTEEINRIGAASRDIYDAYFSEKKAEENINSLIKELDKDE